MIFIVVKQSVRSKFADDWVDLVDEFTTATRAEPGNICFEWYRSVEDPTVYLLVEAFRTKRQVRPTSNRSISRPRAPSARWLAAVPEIVHVEAPGDGWAPMGEVQE